MKQRLFTVFITASLFAAAGFWVSGCKKDNIQTNGTNQPAFKGNSPNSLIFPVNANMYGKSYTEWAVDFWKWEIGYDCAHIFSAGPQTQPDSNVFMLSISTASSTETIAHNKAIFLPLGAVLNDYPCPDANFQPAPGETLEHFLVQGAIDWVDLYSNATLTIDGVTIPSVNNYKFTSGMFNFIGNPDQVNCADPCITGTTQQGAVSGYYVMIKPMSIGTHTIQWSIDYDGVTYTINHTINSI